MQKNSNTNFEKKTKNNYRTSKREDRYSSRWKECKADIGKNS